MLGAGKDNWLSGAVTPLVEVLPTTSFLLPGFGLLALLDHWGSREDEAKVVSRDLHVLASGCGGELFGHLRR